VPIKLVGPGGATIETAGNQLSNNLYQGTDGKRTSLQDAVGIGGVADVNNAFTMNGDKVNPRNAVVTGKMYIQYLPVKEGANGVMKIDEEGAKKWAAIQHANPGVSSEELRKSFGESLHLRKLVTAEATSFSDHSIGWFDNRDPNYYEPTTSDEKDYALEQIDPKKTRLSHSFIKGGDQIAHKHLIFMPAADELHFRESDGNHAIAPQQAFNIDPSLPSPFNTGVSGANIAQGIDYQPHAQQPPSNLSADYWK
jgi:hypothetical protein